MFFSLLKIIQEKKPAKQKKTPQNNIISTIGHKKETFLIGCPEFETVSIASQSTSIWLFGINKGQNFQQPLFLLSSLGNKFKQHECVVLKALSNLDVQ